MYIVFISISSFLVTQSVQDLDSNEKKIFEELMKTYSTFKENLTNSKTYITPPPQTKNETLPANNTKTENITNIVEATPNNVNATEKKNPADKSKGNKGKNKKRSNGTIKRKKFMKLKHHQILLLPSNIKAITADDNSDSNVITIKSVNLSLSILVLGIIISVLVGIIIIMHLKSN